MQTWTFAGPHRATIEVPQQPEYTGRPVNLSAGSRRERFKVSTRIMYTRLHRLAIIAAAVGVGVGSLHAQAPPQAEQTTFRSSVDVVTIQTSVRDGRGRIVQGLTPADFAAQSRHPRRHERQHVGRRQDCHGASGIRFAPRAAARRQRRGRPLYVRFVAARTARAHVRPRRAQERARRFRAVRQHVSVRRDGGHGAASGRTHGRP